jgi:hypothetical protein
MYQAWVGHWFPGFTPANMIELSLTAYVAMYDYMQQHQARPPRGR